MSDGAVTAAGPNRVTGDATACCMRCIAMCVAPVIASYLAYYVFPPCGRINYGTLITPRPATADSADGAGRSSLSFGELAGKWVHACCGAGGVRCCLRRGAVADAPAAADDRQGARAHRAASGSSPTRRLCPPQLLRDYEGTHLVRAPAAAVREFLAPDGSQLAGPRLAGRPDGQPDAALAAGSGASAREERSRAPADGIESLGARRAQGLMDAAALGWLAFKGDRGRRAPSGVCRSVA